MAWTAWESQRHGFAFGEEMLLAQESGGGVAPLRGFFCDRHEPHNPSEALS